MTNSARTKELPQCNYHTRARLGSTAQHFHYTGRDPKQQTVHVAGGGFEESPTTVIKFRRNVGCEGSLQRKHISVVGSGAVQVLGSTWKASHNYCTRRVGLFIRRWSDFSLGPHHRLKTEFTVCLCHIVEKDLSKGNINTIYINIALYDTVNNWL